MTNLPVPILSTEVPGNFLTSALWLANVTNALTYMLNPPLFFGYQATAQSIPSGATPTSVLLDAETVDTYGGHSTTTNTSRYVAQVAGTYLLGGCTAWATNSTDERVTTFAKNGVIIVGGSQVQAAPVSSHAAVVPGSALVVPLAVGDYVEVQASQSTGSSLSTNADVSSGKNSSLMCLWIHA